jgi:serine phosphatase RsbU (regulator of sigma subunit)
MFSFFQNIYFYIFLVLILLVFFSILRWLFLKKYNKPSEKYAKLEKKYIELKNDSEKELTRLNYILETYRKKIDWANQEKKQNSTPSSQTKEVETNLQLKSLISEKEELEVEKEKFAEKNKKLWQQSLAIHKEKERIDLLKKNIERKHNEVTDSIRYAQKIQTALLPSKEVLDRVLPNHFIYWNPRDIVSGDFYWMRQIESKLVIAAADCTGHGVPGAFMSMLGISFLNETVQINSLDAAQILENMRILVKQSLSQTKESQTKDGMDMSLCIVDFNNKKLQFSGANNPLYMLRNGELIVTKAVKNPIGIYAKERNFENTEFDLLSGDVFYIFSDGYPDQFGGADGRKFGYTAFKDLILKANSQKIPLSEQEDFFRKTFFNWKDTINLSGKPSKQVDDVLVIGFQIE